MGISEALQKMKNAATVTSLNLISVELNSIPLMLNFFEKVDIFAMVEALLLYLSSSLWGWSSSVFSFCLGARPMLLPSSLLDQSSSVFSLSLGATPVLLLNSLWGWSFSIFSLPACKTNNTNKLSVESEFF